MDNKTITPVAMAAMAVAGLSQASTKIPAPPVLDSRATSNTPPYPPASDVAEQAATRFLDFVAGLSSTADITQAGMERAFDSPLNEVRPGTYLAKRAVSEGWTYTVAYRAPKMDTKPGFALRFYNKDLTADPTPVCVMDLDRIRSALIPRGFREWMEPMMIGGLSSWNFEKGGLVAMILSKDLSTDSHDRECVLLVKTRDSPSLQLNRHGEDSEMAIATMAAWAREEREGWAAAGLATASDQTTQEVSAKPVMLQAPARAETAEQIVAQFLSFVAGVNGTADITQDTVEETFRVKLIRNNQDSYYALHPLTDPGSWRYSLGYQPPSATTKPGVTLGFFNDVPSADPAPVCVMDLERFRSALIPHGFKEWTEPEHHGGISSWNFEKGDLVVMILSTDFSTDSHGRECVLLVRTRDLK
ncbi:hypothetical protein FHW69_000608 [Luteibacter sp. Sphag1AF]|uniref:hypothetical protein n=1 Tax=Luteibacter sp. Sphag1AF TaxID=2587031 RepID=UPI001618CC93|nr:hypothetical protein [Luteibacter sp. Sphag1AF]MBB3226018.1 hypothetical protein [Luteibacter sp. Sphag1AF]